MKSWLQVGFQCCVMEFTKLSSVSLLMQKSIILTFLASSILFSKMYVMQFLTTSSLRALLAITLPFLSTVSPVEVGSSDQTLIHHCSTKLNLIKHTL